MIGGKQIPSTLLGISFEGTRAHIVQVHRAANSFAAQSSISVDLSAAPTTGNSQELGLEIRRALQQQNIKERRCVVALPLQWVLSLQTRIPELPESDIDGFLSMEAERNFAYDPDSLFVSSSRCRLRSGEQYATIAGVQREQILNVQNTLHAARLKPLSFTLGISSIQHVSNLGSDPVLILVLGNAAVELGITCGDGLIAIRSIENAAAQGTTAINPESIGRELRVTLGQLAPEIRGRLLTARVVGSTEDVAGWKTALAPRLRTMGLEVAPAAQGPVSFDGKAPVAALAVAAAYLAQKKSDFEFLPPKTSAWKQFAGKTSSRKLAWAAGIAAVIALLVLGAFLIQGWQLSNLQSRWNVMAPRVTELEAMQQQIKKFRPWFDNSFPSLSILRKLTEAFPVDGVVTAKTLEIRNQSQVTFSGVARDNPSLFKMLDQLRGTKEVADLKMEQVRGKNPVQFSYNFRWVQGGTGEH